MESISLSRGRASTSSSASSDGFGALLDESLAALAKDCPEAYREMLRRLQGAEVLVEIGREQVVIRGREGGHTLSLPRRDDPPPTATLIAAPDVLLGLLDGELAVLDCLLDDRLLLLGAVPALLGLHEALDWYLRGAVRTAVFPDLLKRFRAWAGRQRRP